MQRDHDPRRMGRTRSLLVTVLIVVLVIAFMLLHLTGVFGPGSH
jgi:hypothetical protein